MRLNFVKACGLGNDFVMIEQEDLANDLLGSYSIKISDRRYGIGCDQIIWAKAIKDSSNYQVKFFNNDSSEAEACGNGSRCIAKFLMEKHQTNHIILHTIGGDLTCKLQEDGNVTVQMPEPKWHLDFDLNAVGRLSEPPAVAVWVGNPHLICFIKPVSLITEYGGGLENHPFFSHRTNVGFVEVLSREEIKIKVWERGSGLTPACGSGACAAAVAANLRGLVNNEVLVNQTGGCLHISFQENKKLLMTGEAKIIFTGTITI